MQKKDELKKTFKIMLFRMWAAGAVCFFGAWGRAGIVNTASAHDPAMQNVAHAFSLNLIAGLAGVMILCDLIIVNPVLRMANGKRILGEKREGIMMFLSLPLQIIKVTAIILCIVFTYYFLNVFFIRVFGLEETSVPVPLEPILFGILYGLYWLLLETAKKNINNLWERKSEKRIS